MGGWMMHTIYAMSDIHGMSMAFQRRLDGLDMDEFRHGSARLILLGDYINRGPDSLAVLEKVYELQKDLGDNMTVLMGNHDKWFLDYLQGHNPQWLNDLKATDFIKEFLSDENMGSFNMLTARHQYHLTHDIVRRSFEAYNGELYAWMKSLPLYYETEHQIYVHAGVDEEAEDWWPYGTSEEMFIEKYPPSKGSFYMDIIAGHVSTSTASGREDNHDIFYDGHSHFYIDGIDSYPMDTSPADCVIPLLKYTESKSTGSYYSIAPDGAETLICRKKW